LFADVDEEVETYGAAVRVSVTAIVSTTVSMNDVVGKIDISMAALRQTIDRIDFILASRTPL
jgi:hypothetical protein